MSMNDKATTIVSGKDEKVYDYSEAIELAGNGRYTVGLTLTLSVALMAMCVELFSFSVVATFSSCDLQLDLARKSFLLSIPFIGSVVMAYPWGYISDTQGRRKSLLIAMSVSYLMSTLCAFAPNWIIFAVLKLISACCCSCAQSATYTLLGESCADRVKGKYLLIMASAMQLNGIVYFVLGYFTAYLDFSYNFGFISFVPWRLLILVLALPLGLTALALVFFYESPKFLLNVGREDEALEALRQICRRNGNNMENYPVQKLVLNEEGNVTRRDVSLLQSLWEQTAPLFKPPLLFNTLLLYYLIFAMYSTNGGLYMWFPFLAKAFSVDSTISSNGDEDGSLCSKIVSTNNATSDSITCTRSIESPVLIAFVAYGTFATILNLLLSTLASRKKALLLALYSCSCICCLGTTVISHNLSNYLYFGVLMNSLCMGPLFSYYVDLYPTSFRGMAACLGVMVARLSSIVGINLVGPFIITECTITFYCLTALIFSGVLMSYFLPPDRPKKLNSESIREIHTK